MQKLILIITILFLNTAVAEIVVKKYKNGKIKSEKNIVNGKKEGLSKVYYKDGALKSKIEYKNNKRHGEALVYHKNGNVKSEFWYIDGRLNGQALTFYKDGDIESHFTFKDDLPIHGIKYLKNGERLIFVE